MGLHGWRWALRDLTTIFAKLGTKWGPREDPVREGERIMGVTADRLAKGTHSSRHPKVEERGEAHPEA